ncbi:MAG: PD-(D/E)XK nuclease family protein, partial [Bacteroidetes bacterium]|nr:PD-(D/E)XK nuclease family protein [Bacteroidota bacterium]
KEINDIYIETINLNPNYKSVAIGENSSKTTVVVKGTKNVLDSIEASMITAKVDLNNYTEEEIQSKLKKKAEEVLDGYKYNNPVILFERSKIINILDNWVKDEFEKLKKWLYHTVFVETKFDNVNIALNTNTIDSDSEKSDSIKLTGRIDRIEINNENKIVIADYKTKNIDEKQSIKNDLQLPLYIHPEVIKAIKEILGIKIENVEESDSYYYSLKYPHEIYFRQNETKTNDIIPMVKVIKNNIDKLIFHQKKNK